MNILKKPSGGGSKLGDEKANVTKTGLSKDYALSYSMYKTEPLVMMFPRAYGGSSFNLEVAEDKSKAIEALQQMPQKLGQQLQEQRELQFYWGGIDGVGTAGPPYVGAIICFLALLGFVLLDGKHKWWILTACVITILMSWGKYFDGFNGLLLKVLPMYDKFRAPSMILVVPTFLLGVMAILTLDKIITEQNRDLLFAKYKKGLLLVAGVFALALLIYFSADFLTENDRFLLKNVSSIQDAQQKTMIEQPVRAFINGMKEDRQGLFMGDILRSFLFILVAGASILLYIRKKISGIMVIAITGVFSFLDIITIDTKYLNSDHFQDASEYDNNFKPTAIDEMISKDTSTYRILDLSQGVSPAFNGGPLSSYFHKSIGGYHPAKLRIYQDLIEKQLVNFPNCMPVLDMLNTKYIITPPQQNHPNPSVQQNPGALGPCWFVKGIDFKKGPSEIMKALTTLNTKDSAILDEQYKQTVSASSVSDSSAYIKLVYNDNDIIEYTSHSKNAEFAVFSEVYYKDGWIATIDGKESPIIRTNYVLRGLSIPAGEHKIVFEFKPASYYNSNKASVAASALIWILLLGAIVSSIRKPKELA